MERAVEMGAGFGVNGDDIGSGIGKRLEVGVRGRDHQMDIEYLFAVSAYGFDDRRTEGDVRHEVAVHHIQVNPVATCGIGCANFFAQSRKIRG